MIYELVCGPAPSLASSGRNQRCLHDYRSGLLPGEPLVPVLEATPGRRDQRFIYYNGRCYCGSSTREGQDLLGLAHVSRQMRHEVLPIIYDMSVVCLDVVKHDPMLQELMLRQAFGNFVAACVRQITITLLLRHDTVSSLVTFFDHIQTSRHLMRVELHLYVDDGNVAELSCAMHRSYLATYSQALRDLQERCCVYLDLSYCALRNCTYCTHKPWWFLSLADELEANRLRILAEREAAPHRSGGFDSSARI